MSLVSIILATFNRASFLQEAVQSILRQRDPDWELLVVDDGSTDNTAEVVRRLTDTRVRYLYQPHGERCVARNFGLRAARGEFVIFADDDDLLHPDMLPRTRRRQFESHANVIYIGSCCIDARGTVLPQAPFIPKEFPDMLRAQLVENFGLGAALIERAWVERVGKFDEQLTTAEDWDLWIRLAAADCIFDCVPEPLLQYRIHDSNTIRDWSRMEQSSEFVLRRALEKYAERTAPYRELAIARQELRNALRRASFRNLDGGIELLGRAFIRMPGFCHDAGVLYQTFCVTQPNGFKGTMQFLDLDYGARFTFGALAQAFEKNPADFSPTERAEILALAHETLAKLYYAKHETRSARTQLRHVLKYQPTRAARAQFASLLLRTCLPPAMAANLRRARRKGNV